MRRIDAGHHTGILSTIAWGVLLVILTVVAYAPLARASFIWDDDSYVTANPLLRQSDGMYYVWFAPLASPQYYPAVFTTLWAEYRLWGQNPLGYHAINLLFHVGNALLLWRLLDRLKVRAAWPAAAIFALHPVHVETVAWITELKNTQSLFFYLLAFAAYWCGGFLRLEESIAPPRRARWGWYTLALLCFVLALLSKSVTASWPAAVLLVTWWKTGRIRRSDVWPLLPFFAIGIAMGTVTAWLEKRHVGAVGSDWNLTLIDRALVAGRAAWFYAGKLAFPHPLIFVYRHWEVDAHQWWQWVFPAGAAIVVIALFAMRNRIGRGPLTATLLFAGTLFPALGFANVYPMRFSFVADHFQYHASIGMIVLIASVLMLLLDRLSRWRGAGSPAWVMTPLVGLLAVAAFHRAQAFTNAETLYRDTLKKNDSAWLAYDNLGAICRDSGRYSEAVEHYRRAMALRNDSVHHVNLGYALVKAGALNEGIMSIEQGIALDPADSRGYFVLGEIDAGRGKLIEAARNYEIAVQRRPDDCASYLNLGGVYDRLGDVSRAIDCYRRANDLAPGRTLADAHFNLAAVYAKTKRTREAEEELLAARAADPERFDRLAGTMH